MVESTKLINYPELLAELKTELSSDLKDLVDDEETARLMDEHLVKFLYWKPSVPRAAQRFRSFIKWIKENPWAVGSDDDTKDMPLLLASQDDSLKRILSCRMIIAPEGLRSKSGSGADPNSKGGPVIIGRLRYNNMSDGRTPQDVCRMMFYLVDHFVLDKHGRAMEEGVTIFHDMTGLSLQNLHPEIPKLLFRGLIGHFPLRVKGIYILNAPVFFTAFFKVISTVTLPSKIRKRMHFVSSIDDIYRVLPKDELLVEHGGQLDFDVEKWVEESCCQAERDELAKKGRVKSLLLQCGKIRKFGKKEA